MSILETPLEIYLRCSCFFPQTNADVEVNKEGVITSLTLNLSGEDVPYLKLQFAVTTPEFVRALTDFRPIVEWAKLMHTQPPALDPDSFSTQVPLADWQKFRRVMYEKHGHNCINLLIEFLQNPSDENLSILSKLGFAPEQVENHPASSDLNYFKALPALWKTKDQATKGLIVSNFRRIFPQISQLVMRSLGQGALEQSRRGSHIENEYDRILQTLQTCVIGQAQATEKLAAALLSQQRPDTGNQVYMFVGPSGVGKTSLAKAASLLKDNRFVYFEMNQYTSDFSIATFFGPGSTYVGSTSKSHFAQAFEPFISREESSHNRVVIKDVVLLFDEFEKAHSTIKQSLLRIFDEGTCKFNYVDMQSLGHSQNITLEYVFKNSIIICTSNLFQQEILAGFRQRKTMDELSEQFIEMNRVFFSQHTYSTELLRRMTIIPFGPIPRGRPYQSVIKTELNKFFEELKRTRKYRDISIENEDLLLASIENRLYGEGVDLRRIYKDFLTEHVRVKILQAEHTWGPVTNLKLIFSCDELGSLIKILYFVEDFNDYSEVGIPEIRC